MRVVFVAVALSAALLGGCASQPRDPNGIWINQAAIDAAAKGGHLRQALLAYGPVLEWNIDTKAGQAVTTNGFELSEGSITSNNGGKLRVGFYGSAFEELTIKGSEMTQAASDSGPEQHFSPTKSQPEGGSQPGISFERALYEAYLGGKWTITSGDGQGSTVQFSPDGGVSGLPENDRYALCLAGDCAAMSGDYDSMWLEKNQQGAPWIFVRDGKRLEIYQALNNARADEMPDLRPGQRRWVLEKN